MLIEKIHEAVFDLQYGQRCKEGNVIVAFSRLMEHYLIRELQEFPYPLYQPIDGVMKIHGCDCNRDWPYNEIVVYDKENACRNPRLLIKIEVNV